MKLANYKWKGAKYFYRFLQYDYMKKASLKFYKEERLEINISQ